MTGGRFVPPVISPKAVYDRLYLPTTRSYTIRSVGLGEQGRLEWQEPYIVICSARLLFLIQSFRSS
jgi:hypothetical protein